MSSIGKVTREVGELLVPFRAHMHAMEKEPFHVAGSCLASHPRPSSSARPALVDQFFVAGDDMEDAA